VGRVVGSQGSGVNKLRDLLGVRIDFSDDGDDTKDAGKKKRGTSQKSKITVCKNLQVHWNKLIC
jgi:hypothetical protein